MLSSLTRREFKLLGVTVLVAICGSLGSDIHLASLPHIMAYMHTDKQHMQQSVTLFFLGVGLSILVYGPLSDQFGRKPIVIWGLSMASIASFLTIWVQHIEPFLILRVLQGAGSGVCWGLGRVIMADLMQGVRLASIGSYLSLFLTLSPLLAPALGGHVQHWFGWKANFVVLGSTILFALIMFALFFEETNQHKTPRAFSPKRLAENYSSFFKNRLFVGCVLLTGISMSANIIYMTLSSFIFQGQFHTSPVVFGWLTGVLGVVSIIGKLIAPSIFVRLKKYKSLILGVSLLLSGGLFLSTFSLIHMVNIPIVLIGISIVVPALVLMGSITMSMALSPFREKRGSAGALFGSFQLIISFIFSAIAGSLPHSGTSVLATAYVILGVLGFSCYFFLVREKKSA